MSRVGLEDEFWKTLYPLQRSDRAMLSPFELGTLRVLLQRKRMCNRSIILIATGRSSSFLPSATRTANRGDMRGGAGAATTVIATGVVRFLRATLLQARYCRRPGATLEFSLR